MNTIGFTNFRKFTEFPSIELGGVTLLVGGNNSGKSTLVKAMLLMHNFLIQQISSKGNFFDKLKPVFRFDSNYVHIGSFKRAFCNKNTEGEDTMSFSVGIGQFVIEVDVKGNLVKDIPLADVTRLYIKDTKREVSFCYNYSNHNMTSTFSMNEEERNTLIAKDKLEKQRKELDEEKSNSKELNHITELSDMIKNIDTKLKALSNIESTGDLEVSYQITLESGVTSGLLIPELVKQFSKYPGMNMSNKDKRTAEYKKEENDKNILRGKSEIINNIADDLTLLLSCEQIEYIYAHSASQQVLFNTKDSGDFLTKTIHEFFMERISDGDSEYEFIKKWMTEFEIGINFEVKDPIAGEAYQVEITDEDGSQVQLADKGMGSIQLMILLLRFATLIRRYKGSVHPITILIEEPEQNLHPALQSKLAELLFDVNQTTKCQFIVETHSEYLIRRSQVIVATSYGDADKLPDNPFRTYYLPKNGTPDAIGYNENGRFEGKFGEGFFDEAGKSNIILMKKERGIL